MALDEQVEKRVYDKLRAFDGLELSGNSPVDSSIASVLSQGEVLADNGEQYESIQEAVDASDNWVFVGPGTYYENVVIEKDDFTLQGAGYDTLIDGGDVGIPITTRGANSNISGFRLQSSSFSGMDIDANGAIISNIFVDGTAAYGIYGGPSVRETVIANCRVEQCGSQGLRHDGERTIVKDCHFDNNTAFNLNLNGDDSIAANNVLLNGQSLNSSLECSVNNSILIGNRVHNSSGDGIRVDSGVDPIVANNRVSGSSGTDLNVSATGAVTDGNISGSAN